MTAVDLSAEEQREKAIREAMAKHFYKDRNAIVSGDDAKAIETCNSLIDYLEKSVDLQHLVRKALSGSADVTGKAFVDLLVKVMQADAEIEAIREVERLEDEAIENSKEMQIDRSIANQGFFDMNDWATMQAHGILH